MQAVGAMYRLGNVDMARCFEYLKNHRDQFIPQGVALMGLEDAYENFRKGEMMTFVIGGLVSNPHIQFYNLPIPGVFTICCPLHRRISNKTLPNWSGLSASDLTQAEIALAEEVRESVAEMKKSLPGFENAYVLDCPEICVRETRHIQGEYVLNINEVFLSQEFNDTIGKGSHPLDISPIPDVLRKHSLPRGWSFNIPYRCLVPKEIDNLLLAGRCISNTHEASGCTRVTVVCMITGEAAGTAAAMCVKENVKPQDLDTNKLRRKLTEQGVVL